MRSEHYTSAQWAAVDVFHRLHYGLTPSWLGVPVLKNPMDLIIYQEILTSTRPEVIIESGTGWGGSTLFFASLCELLRVGEVISIDARGEEDIPEMYRGSFGPEVTPVQEKRPVHPRITYLTGDSTSRTMQRTAAREAKGRRTMVVLDSTHTYPHMLKESRLYGPLVSPGCYLSMEDVNPVHHQQHGPYNAAIAFLQAHPQFKWNTGWADRFLMTQNAWLLRVEGA